MELTERERNEGRKAVHSEHVPFVQWVEEHGGELDTGNLIPFTRWLTPADITKRFSTQMYIYFLPIGKLASQMHLPTPDGGVEHTAATFASPQEWLGAALTREIVLFPPQFFLLWLVGDFLKQGHGTLGMDGLEEQRYRLIQFVESGDPPWGEKCISPNPVKMVGDTLILGMGGAGPEVKESARKGDEERVLRVELAEDLETGGRRSWPKEVLMKRDVFKDGKWNL